MGKIRELGSNIFFQVCVYWTWFGYVKQKYCILDAAEAAILRNISDYHHRSDRGMAEEVELSFS